MLAEAQGLPSVYQVLTAATVMMNSLKVFAPSMSFGGGGWLLERVKGDPEAETQGLPGWRRAKVSKHVEKHPHRRDNSLKMTSQRSCALTQMDGVLIITTDAFAGSLVGGGSTLRATKMSI